MIKVIWATTAQPRATLDSALAVTPDALAQAFTQWQSASDKGGYISSLPLELASALCSHVSDYARAVRPTLQPDQEVLSYREAAIYLGISESTFSQLVSNHQLACEKRGTRKFVSRIAIEALAQQRKQ